MLKHRRLTLVVCTALSGSLLGCVTPAPEPDSSSGGSGGTTGSKSGGSEGASSGGGRGGNSSGSGGASGGSGGNASAGSGGSGGSTPAASGGSVGSGGQGNNGSGGKANTDPQPGNDAGASGGATGAADASGEPLAKFSFFYTSLAAMRRLSKSQNGFGGDLRFGLTNGLDGADKICQTIAADEGFGGKTWRAFLSAFKGPDGMQVNAIDRVGNGPWYDRRGRLIAMDKAGLLAGNRPAGDPQTVSDLPDEKGEGRPKTTPNDTHDVITGSDRTGKLRARTMADTCMDWTAATGRGTIGMGHSWPAGSGMHWIQAHTEPTCVAGVNLVQNGPGNGSSIGAGGGWGGFYCFALTP